MTMKKKMFLSTAALCLLSSTGADAQMSVQLNVGVPAYMVAPAPVYVSPYPDYYDPRHRRHDSEYWQQRKAHERPEHADNRNHAEQGHGEHEHR